MNKDPMIEYWEKQKEHALKSVEVAEDNLKRLGKQAIKCNRIMKNIIKGE